MNAEEARELTKKHGKDYFHSLKEKIKLEKEETTTICKNLANKLFDRAQLEIDQRSKTGCFCGWIAYEEDLLPHRKDSRFSLRCVVFSLFVLKMNELGFKVYECNKSIPDDEGFWNPAEGIRIEW